LIFGVTGGVGSGKTTFVHGLAQCGATVIDADDIGKSIVENSQEIRDSLKQTFGHDIFDSKGALRRRYLGQIVFSDLDKLKTLNKIVVPTLKKSIQDRIAAFRIKNPKKMAVLDMAILHDTDLDRRCDRICIVTAPMELRRIWLQKDRGWKEEEVNQRIWVQMKLKTKRRKADYIIENTGSIEQLKFKARIIYQSLITSTA
jgi:dephospho-CoA kinase